ncbi:MAG: DUF6982 domain-containing protein [Myxococcota bacterium]
MAEVLRVVARFRDGRTLKGTTQDFKPASPRFHLVPADGGPPVEARLDALKAVFFVRRLEGDPGRGKLRGFVEAAAETTQGKKIAVRFKDDELLCGYTLTYSPGREGFFLFPADVGGNNLRVYVVTAAAAEIKAGPAAEQLAARVLASRS